MDTPDLIKFEEGLEAGRSEAGLFSVIPQAVMRDQNLNSSAKLLYGAILSLSRHDGFCYATNRYLAENVGIVGEDSIKKPMKKLKEAGLIDIILIKRPDGRSSRHIRPLLLVGGFKSPWEGGKFTPQGGFKSPPNNIKDKIKNNIHSVFEYWNSKNVPHHRVLSPKIEGELGRKLKIYSEAEIKAVIDLYETILERGVDSEKKKYFWSYEWGLSELLSRGWEKFDGRKPENFLKKKDRYAQDQVKVLDFTKKK